jgi:hypothetical protein
MDARCPRDQTRVFGHAHRLAEAGRFELELVFDFAATAPARTKAVVRSSLRAARFSLERVGDLDRELGEPPSSFIAYVAGDADDRVVALVDCGDGLVVEVINVAGDSGMKRADAVADGHHEGAEDGHYQRRT